MDLKDEREASRQTPGLGFEPQSGFGAVGRAAQWEGEEETGKISVRAGEFLVPEGKPPGRGSRGDPGLRGASPPGTGASTVTEPVPTAKPAPWPERGSPRKVGSVLGEETGRSGEEAAAHPKG